MLIAGGEARAARALTWTGWQAYDTHQVKLAATLGRAAKRLVDGPAVKRDLATMLPNGAAGQPKTAVRMIVASVVGARANRGVLGKPLVATYRTGWKEGTAAAKHALTVSVTKDDRPLAAATVAQSVPRYYTIAAPSGSTAGAPGPLVSTSIDWSTWTPGSVLQANAAATLEELISSAVGTDEGWAARVADRGSLLASIEDNRIGKLVDAVTQALTDGTSVDDLSGTLDGVLDDPAWADMVATTELARSMTAASMATYREAGIPSVVWYSAADERVCPACSENEDVGEIPLGGDWPNGAPPVHPNCLVGPTRVVVPSDVALRLAEDLAPAAVGMRSDRRSHAAAAVTEPERDFGRMRVRAASDRHYVGEIVTIRLASGHELSGTPNHPIAASRGWVALSQLKMGDQVLHSTRPEWITASDPDEDDVPPAIEQVAKSFTVPLGPMPTAAEDFHGDGAGSDVHVVRTNRLLRRDGMPAGAQLSGQLPLGGASVTAATGSFYSERSLAGVGVTASAAAYGVMGRSSEGGTILGARLGHSQEHRIAAPTDRDIAVDESLADGAAADAEGFCEQLLAFAVDVAASDVVAIDRDPFFSGHVYNLDTSGGWYIGNGIISHNCRCALGPGVIQNPSDAEIVDALAGGGDAEG